MKEIREMIVLSASKGYTNTVCKIDKSKTEKVIKMLNTMGFEARPTDIDTSVLYGPITCLVISWLDYKHGTSVFGDKVEYVLKNIDTVDMNKIYEETEKAETHRQAIIQKEKIRKDKEMRELNARVLVAKVKKTVKAEKNIIIVDNDNTVIPKYSIAYHKRKLKKLGYNTKGVSDQEIYDFSMSLSRREK